MSGHAVRQQFMREFRGLRRNTRRISGMIVAYYVLQVMVSAGLGYWFLQQPLTLLTGLGVAVVMFFIGTRLRGFNNIFKVHYSLVGLDALNAFDEGDRITPEDLAQRQILRNLNQPVKVEGNGEITKAVTVAAHKFTRSARERIEAAGGRVEEL